MGEIFGGLESFIQSAKQGAVNAVKQGTAAIRKFLDRLDAEADGVTMSEEADDGRAATCLDELKKVRDGAAVTSAASAGTPVAIGPGALILINLAITMLQEWLKKRQTP
jgi:hypothetical protein